MKSRWARANRRLGLARPWWTIPVTLVYMVALSLTLLFACTGFVALENHAKKPETRARSVDETVALAAENRRANQWRQQARSAGGR